MRVIVAAVAVLIIYYIIRIIGRIFLSPLRNVPGPWLGKCSIGWQLWHLYRGDYHISLQAAHAEYGTFVRVGYNEISVSDPEVINAVLIRPLRKHTWYKIFAMPDSTWPNTMSELDPKRFAFMHKKIAGAYMLSNLLRSENAVDDAISLLQSQVDGIPDRKGFRTVPLDQWFTYFAFDIVGEMTFSKSFGFLEAGVDIGECIATSHRLLPYLSIMAYFHYVHELLTHNPLMTYLDVQPMKHVMNTTQCAVSDYEKNSCSLRFDMVGCWKSQNNSTALSHRELLAAANANVAAGSDTVGSTMQAFVYLVLRNPSCLQKLRSELDLAAVNNLLSSPIQYAEAQQLPYFQACIKEIYRFHPVSAASYPRVAPRAGIEIAGRMFPEGTVLSANPWVLHREKDIFGDNADIFSPERWLQPDSKAMEARLITFGAGYMSCPGKAMAHIQLSKLLSTIFREYDIELTTPKKPWLISSSLLIRPYGWCVNMKPRLKV